MTVGIQFKDGKGYKLVTIESNNKMTVGKEYLDNLTGVTRGTLS